MNRRQCKDCYFNETCSESKVCDDFTPLADEIDDSDVDKMVEQRRDEYRLAWHTYISEYED